MSNFTLVLTDNHKNARDRLREAGIEIHAMSPTHGAYRIATEIRHIVGLDRTSNYIVIGSPSRELVVYAAARGMTRIESLPGQSA